MHKSNLQSEFKNLERILEDIQVKSLKFIKERQTKSPRVGYRPGAVSSSSSLEGVGTMKAVNEFFDLFSPYLAQNIGPRYFGFVTGGITPASLAGDWLASSFDQVVTSDGESSAAFVERSTIKMLIELLDLPSQFTGSFVTGATMSNFVSLAIARQWLGEQLGENYHEDGISNSETIKVLSGTAHSSISKSLSMLGIGRSSLQLIDTQQGRERIDITDLKRKLELVNHPCIVVANAGTVTLGDFDQIGLIAELKEKYNFWLHVDAAFGGLVGSTEEYNHLVNGWEEADSITIDCHKWMNVPYDSAIQLTRHPNMQLKVFTNSAEYLESPNMHNFIHLTPENSRRFRALPVWMTIKAYGAEPIKNHIRRNIQWTFKLADDLKTLAKLKLIHPPISNVICFKIGDGETEVRNKFLSNLSKDGKVFFSPSMFEGQAVVRGALCNWTTNQGDRKIVVGSIKKALQDL